MNFFVSYGDELSPIMKVFRLTGQDSKVTFKNVIDKFAEICNIKDGIQLKLDQLNLYLIDNTYPYMEPVPKEITNLDFPVMELNLDNFELILSTEIPKLKSPISQPTTAEVTKTDADAAQFEDLIQKGQISLATKDYNNAWGMFRHARVLNDQDYRPLYYSTKILMATHRYNIALANATTGLQLFPFSREMHMLYAKLHYKMEKYSNAIDMYQFTLYNWEISKQEKHTVYCKIAKCMIAMGRLGEALSLIENVKDNVGCIFTTANIYLIQDDFYKACKKAISAFFITPDYKRMEVFIANAITSKERAEIFLTELGDTKTDPSTLFFFGSSLYKCGEFHLSLDYLLQALAKSSMVSSIAVLTLKAIIANGGKEEVVLQFVKKFLELNITKNFTDAISPILLKKEQKDDFTDTTQYSPLPMKNVAFEKEEPSFRTEDIDTLSLIITFMIYMFQGGYVKLTQEICEALSPLILPFEMTNTICAGDSLAFCYLTALCPSIPRPLNSSLQKLFVIGDRSPLCISHREIFCLGEKRIVQPIIIEGLSLRSLSEKRRTPQHSLLRNAILNLPEGSVVMLFFGTEDVLRGKIKQTVRMEYDTIEQAYQENVNTYTIAASQLVDQIRGTVLVHPVVPTSPVLAPQTLVFDSLLKEKIESVGLVKKQLMYVDILDYIMKEDKSAILPELEYNDFFMSCEYANHLSKYFEEHFQKK